MEISNSQIKKSLKLVEKNNYFDKLNNIYNEIPNGKCSGCTKCCMESVNTFYIEFLNILNYINKKNLLEKYMEYIERHYFNELIEKKSCPFLDIDGKCVIYPVRPLVCRLFGYATKEEHEQSYLEVFKMNKEADEYFLKEYKHHIAKDVINHKIEFCVNYKSEKNISLNKRNKMIDEMFIIDSKFLMNDLIPEDAINISLTNWFIYTKYSEEEASIIRIDRLLNS